jgi:hypothetical protein
MDESPEEPQRAGVRALIVAMNSRNGEGAKERRKVEGDEQATGNSTGGSA